MMAKDKAQETTPKEDEQKYPLRMPKTTHRELRILTVTDGLSMNSVINEAIIQWMDAYKKKKAEDAVKKALGQP